MDNVAVLTKARQIRALKLKLEAKRNGKATAETNYQTAVENYDSQIRDTAALIATAEAELDALIIAPDDPAPEEP